MGFASSGMKRCRSSSMSSSIECINEIQYLCPNLKKQKVDYRLSFSSSLGKEINGFSEVKGSVSDIGGEKKQRVDQILDFSSSMGKEKTRDASKVMGSVSDGGEKKGRIGFSDSSTKAARAEMLKKRFGRIIVKAEEFQVEDRRRSDHHQKVDPVEIQRKNRILEKKLKEAQIVAEAELKMELQRKREAARKALLELERSISVEVDDNARTMKDFAVMLGYPRNCAVCLCNEIGWYGAPVMVYSNRRTS